MGDLISRLQGDGTTLWRPDVRKEALKESTIRPKSNLILRYRHNDIQLGPKLFNYIYNMKIPRTQNLFIYLFLGYLTSSSFCTSVKNYEYSETFLFDKPIS